MNSLFSQITLILSLCVNLVPGLVHADPVDGYHFNNISDEENDLTVDRVNMVWDGGSIMIEGNSRGLKFKILLQHPQKDLPVSFVKVYVFDSPSNPDPNAKIEILPGSRQEMKLVKLLTRFLEIGSVPKFEPDVRTALKYISNRNLPWVFSDWIRPK